MIQYNFKSSLETTQLLKEYSQTTKRLEALKNFNFAFQFIDLIKSLDIKEFAFNYYKDDYNDEGLYDGVYTSVTDKDMNVIKIFGYSFDEYVNGQFDESGKYNDKIFNLVNENEKLKKLNKFLDDLIVVHNEKTLVSKLYGRVFGTVKTKDFHKIIGKFVGSKNLKEWEINLDKINLDQNIESVKSVTSSNVDNKSFRKKI